MTMLQKQSFRRAHTISKATAVLFAQQGRHPEVLTLLSSERLMRCSEVRHRLCSDRA